MPLTIQIEENRMTAALSGELDHHHTARLREEIDAAARRDRPAELVLDFSRVEFMDSSGIGLVLGRYRLMQELEGCITLRAMPPHIKRVMKIAGIGSLPIKEEEVKA